MNETTSWPHRSAWILGTLACGLLLSGGAARWQEQANQAQAAAALQAASDRATELLLRRVELYEYGLRGARGAIQTAGPERLNHALFRRYTSSRDIDREFPGAYGFGFIERVPRAREVEFLRRQRADGLPDFAIRELGANDGDRYVIDYVEPQAQNAAALGLDIASQVMRRAAALAAMRSGQATATGPITLVQGHGEQARGMLVLLPVYASSQLPADPARREAELWGWAYTAVSFAAETADILSHDDGLSMSAVDVDAAGHGEFLFGTEYLGEPLLGRDVVVPIFGRQWRVSYAASEAFIANLHQLAPQSVFAVGALASLLLAGLVALYRVGRDRARQADVQRARLASVVASSADAIVGQDPQGRVVFWNAAAEKLFGYRADEAIGRPVAELILIPERRGEDAELIAKVLAGRTMPTYETVRWTRDGEAVEVSISAGPIRAADGEIIGVGKVVRDIRSRIAWEKQLVEFNQRLEEQVQRRTEELERAHHDLRTVMDALPSLIGYWDKDLRNRVANAAYAAWFGVAARDLHGRHLKDLLGPELFELNRPYVEGALRGEAQTFERSLKWPDGQGDRHSLAHYMPDAVNGEVRGFYVIVHDVTELVASRRALANERQRLENVIDGTLAGTWAWNIESGECRFNERWAGMLGYTLRELEPHRIATWRDLVHPDDLATAEAGIARHLHGEEATYQVEIRLQHKNGSWVWVMSRGRLFTRTPDGEPEWMYGTHLDINTLKHNEEALRAASQAAEAASQAKGRFLANMSHEIRTPLNAIIGIGELLLDSELDPDTLQLTRKLQLAGRSLLGVVDNVLDLSRIESGELAMERIGFAPPRLVAEVHELFQTQAAAKGLKLLLRGVETLPAWALGDPQRLRQVLTNLLNNALKFTSEGSVTLAAERVDDAADPGLAIVRWTVTDTGCGMAPEVLERLFQPFVQADASTTRRFGGSGLGLAIVRELVQLMGGEVGVASEPGAGSSFWVRTPLAVADHAADDPDALEAIVVDDVALDREQISAMCRGFGWRAVELGSGEALLELMRGRAAQGARLPDVLLIDWRMPGLDGLQCLERLKDELGERQPAALITSAYERAQAEAQALKQVVDDVLIKPVHASELFNAVNHAVVAHSGRLDQVLSTTRLNGAGTRWLVGQRLLVVDDSEINLEVARRLLERQGAQVTTAGDGVEALERLAESPRAFDLVLMDAQMPRMDGFEATRRLRSELGLTGLPVFALTAGALAEERRRALDAGMTGFLTKPLDTELLVRTVRAEIEKARGRSLPVESQPDAVAPPHWPEIAGVDTREAMDRTGGDARFFVLMLERMLGDYDAAAWLAQRVETFEAERQSFSARMHKLRGSSGALGAREVHERAGAAEVALRGGVAADEALAQVHAVAASLLRLAEAAAPVIVAQRLARRGGGVPAEPLADEEIEVFVELLTSRDLAALDWMNEHSAQLAASVPAEIFDELERVVGTLDFDAALQLLAARPATA